MKKIIALMLFLTFFAHANDSEPGSQYLKAAEAGDRRAQYFLADSWFSSGDLSKAEYWAQKAADSGDADACALLAQIKITNPVSLDYPQAKVLAEKAAQAGSKEGEVTLAHILVNTQAGKPDYPKAISLLENASCLTPSLASPKQFYLRYQDEEKDEAEPPNGFRRSSLPVL